MELFHAASQWATRPADQRFWDLASLYKATLDYAKTSVTKTVALGQLTAAVEDRDVVVRGPLGVPAHLTHWAFGQLANRVGAPASYLRSLPAPLAAQCLQQGLNDHKQDEGVILFHKNGSLLARAITSDRYERIWNWQVAKWAMDLPGQWATPPAWAAHSSADGKLVPTRTWTAEDASFWGNRTLVKAGDTVSPSGLYASDHDCFLFLADPTRPINTPNGRSLIRGFFLKNSEVGNSSLVMTMFLYDFSCGNHIIWGAENVREIRIRHVGENARKAYQQIVPAATRIAALSAADDEKRIKLAWSFKLGDTREEVVDALYAKDIASRSTLGEAFDVAKKFDQYHGDPRTAWGLASGLTRLSQATEYQDEREALDRAAGKVVEFAF